MASKSHVSELASLNNNREDSMKALSYAAFGLLTLACSALLTPTTIQLL
jgi:hypothetical protein